jgi:hypothetical protein
MPKRTYVGYVRTRPVCLEDGMSWVTLERELRGDIPLIHHMAILDIFNSSSSRILISKRGRIVMLQKKSGKRQLESHLYRQVKYSPIRAQSTDTLKDVEEWVYITEITVGTPPQSFRVLLSISDSDILLPSDLCDFTCEDNHRYQSKLSSTYVPNGTALGRYYVRFSASGVVSQDTVRIAGIEIKNVSFAQANDMYCTIVATAGQED